MFWAPRHMIFCRLPYFTTTTPEKEFMFYDFIDYTDWDHKPPFMNFQLFDGY